jgi:hypothetical protein
MQFDYAKFINEGYISQQKYAEKVGEYGPRQFQALDSFPAKKLSGLEAEMAPKRYAKIIEHFGHLIEEAIEARVYVPRRSWKTSEPSYLDSDKLRKEFIAELFDILLFHRAILAYAGITGEEFTRVAAEKLEYNSRRPDHNINSNEPAQQDPAKELQGNCPSADFNSTSNNAYDRD